MPKFDFYSAWMDPVFYLWAAAAAAALLTLVYSIRRYLEIKNGSVFEEETAPEAPADPDLLPPLAEQPELPEPAAPEVSVQERHAAMETGPGSSRAETFVRGIYEGISGLDARLRVIESILAKSRLKSDFTIKFLEDMLVDIDSLDKPKLKGRIEYLLSDLKK